jgi:hypothetical protein
MSPEVARSGNQRLHDVRFAPEANIGALRASCALRKSVVAPLEVT